MGQNPRLAESLPTPLEAHNLTRPHEAPDEARQKYTNQAPDAHHPL